MDNGMEARVKEIIETLQGILSETVKVDSGVKAARSRVNKALMNAKKQCHAGRQYISELNKR